MKNTCEITNVIGNTDFGKNWWTIIASDFFLLFSFIHWFLFIIIYINMNARLKISIKNGDSKRNENDNHLRKFKYFQNKDNLLL